MSETNSSVVRQVIELLTAHHSENLSDLSNLIATNYVGHLPLGDHYGLEGVRIDRLTWFSAFPDLTISIEELLEIGDLVVRRCTLRGTHQRPFLGLAPTGQQFTAFAIAIDRLAHHKLVESWVAIDLYG